MVGAEPLIVCDVCQSKGCVAASMNVSLSEMGYAGTKLWDGHLCPTCRDHIKDGEWGKLTDRHVTEEEAKAGLLHLREDLLEA